MTTVNERLQILVRRIEAMNKADADYRAALVELNAAQTDTEKSERWDVARLVFARLCYETNAAVRSVTEFAETGRAQIISDLEKFNQLASRYQAPETQTPSVLQN